MFFTHKKILLATLFLYSSITFGWNFSFSNVTERILVIAYKLEGLSQEYYQILQPDQSVSYYFPNLHCFGGSILWAEYKEKDSFGRDLAYHGGIDLVDPVSGEILKGTAQNLFATQVANKYAFIPMQIKVVDNETFQYTINAAEEFAHGLDALACETINTAVMFTNPTAAIIGNSGPSQSADGGISSDIMKKIKTAAQNYFKPSEEPEQTPYPHPTDMPPTMDDLMNQGILDQEGQLVNTNMAIATTTQQPTTIPTKCRFGLGQMAKAGATLAGITLCRDLHFVIVDTGEIGTPMPTQQGITVSRVKKPILIAEINQGG